MVSYPHCLWTQEACVHHGTKIGCEVCDRNPLVTKRSRMTDERIAKLAAGAVPTPFEVQELCVAVAAARSDKKIYVYPTEVHYVPSNTRLTRWYMCVPLPNGRRKHVALSAQEAMSQQDPPFVRVTEAEHREACPTYSRRRQS